MGEKIAVHYVEAFAGVYRRGRAVDGLDASRFRLYEDGIEQEVLHFEPPEAQPFHVVLLVDVSDSMEHRLDTARMAALRFLRRSLRSEDRAAIVTFRHRPMLRVDFTADFERLRAGLRGLEAKGATSLYDALSFGLRLLGTKTGKRALLVFSDGRDEGSRLDFEGARELARRAGILVYMVGLDRSDDESMRRRFTTLADETGGRAFFINGIAALVPIYGSIARDLGLRYLLAYQSANTGSDDRFRELRIEVVDAGFEVRAMNGYFPRSHTTGR